MVGIAPGACRPGCWGIGVAVIPGEGLPVDDGGMAVDVAQGALVPESGVGLEAVGVIFSVGLENVEVCGAVGGGSMAFGSWSQRNKEPNGKCCTTGNLESTSALYILIMP